MVPSPEVGKGRKLAVSVIPVGRGTAGLLLRNGTPSPLSGAPAGDRADGDPSLGTRGEVSGAGLWELGELETHPPSLGMARTRSPRRPSAAGPATSGTQGTDLGLCSWAEQGPGAWGEWEWRGSKWGLLSFLLSLETVFFLSSPLWWGYISNREQWASYKVSASFSDSSWAKDSRCGGQ